MKCSLKLRVYGYRQEGSPFLEKFNGLYLQPFSNRNDIAVFLCLDCATHRLLGQRRVVSEKILNNHHLKS
jgi:hypothetical protein